MITAVLSLTAHDIKSIKNEMVSIFTPWHTQQLYIEYYVLAYGNYKLNSCKSHQSEKIYSNFVRPLAIDWVIIT